MSKLTGASALFVAVKYTTILYNILFLVVWSPNLSDKVFDMFECATTALSLMISCRRASYLRQLSQGCSNSSSYSCNFLIKSSYAMQFASYFLLAGERIGVHSVDCI